MSSRSVLARSVLALVLMLLIGWPLLATVLAARGRTNEPVGIGSGLIAPIAQGSDEARVPRPLRLATTSLEVVLAAEAMALPVGVVLALLLFRTDLWGRRVGIALTGFLMFVPLPLMATAWLGALGNAGRAQALGLGPIVTGLWGAAFLHALAGLPWVVFLGGVGLRSVEPELEESALLDLPAWRVLGQVTVRRSVGALAGAALALAVLTAGDMTVTDLLQVRTYAEEAYIQYQLGHGPGAAAAVAVPPLVVLGVLVVLVAWGLFRADPARLATAVGPGRGKVWRLGRWRVPLGLVVGLSGGPVIAVPVYSLFWWAGRVGGLAAPAGGGGPAWSLGGLTGTLGAAFADAAGPLRDSLVWSALGASAAVGLAWPLAWVSRTPGPWRGVVGLVVALTLATPGPVAGMALVLACLPIPALFDSPLMIVLAVMLRTLPFALLVLWPAVRTIPPAWLEAAALDGHGTWGQVRRVALPASRDALLAAWGVAFVLGLGELPATNLVAPPGTTPLSTLIWSLLHSGVESQLAGVALVLLAAIALAGAGLVAGWAFWLRPPGSGSRTPPGAGGPDAGAASCGRRPR
jgi:iron(III) transport system permease protein